MDLLIGISILLSASTYLFDFVSNILVAVRYAQLYFERLRQEKEGVCSDKCRIQTRDLAGYFWGMIWILFCSHTLNALVFKFRVSTKDNPFRAAYFLPLIHLWRLVYLVWNTLSCKGIGALRSAELNGLFSILGTSFEGMPVLILQIGAYIVLVKGNALFHEISLLFKISVVASLLSVAYTGGASVESIAASHVKSLFQRLQVVMSAGLFTMFSSMSRCITYINIIIHMRDYFQRNRSARSKAKYHVTDSLPILFLGFNIAFYWLFYWLFQFPKLMRRRLHSWKICLMCLLFGTMSIVTGPLYSMVSEAREMNELGSCSFRRRLLCVVFINLCVDAAVTTITFWMRTLSNAFLFTSMASVIGCLVSIFWYALADAKCEDNLAAHSRTVLKGHEVKDIDVRLEDISCDSFHTAHDQFDDVA